MRKIDENPDEPTSCRCSAHREFTPVTHHSQSASPKGLRFTPDMIRDQEMLVSSMSQQGISEDLIRRQFERLLEEQTKQLRLIKDEPVTNKADPEKLAELKTRPKAGVDYTESDNYVPPEESFVTPECNHLANQAEVCKVSPSQETGNQLQSQPPMSEEKLAAKTHATSDAAVENTFPPSRIIEPSSLLKIRLKKEAIHSSKRNNGLQEGATALKIIKDSKSKIAQDRLSPEVEGLLKLNGVQERTPTEQVQFNHIIEADALCNKTENQGKITSANGLENSRNLDNPPFRRLHPHSPATINYAAPTPMRNSDKLIESHPHPSSAEAEAKATNAHFEATPQQTLYSELQEPKVIGGFTYFARKSHCIPNISGATYGFPFDHPNHKISSQSKPTTAFPISH